MADHTEVNDEISDRMNRSIGWVDVHACPSTVCHRMFESN